MPVHTRRADPRRHKDKSKIATIVVGHERAGGRSEHDSSGSPREWSRTFAPAFAAQMTFICLGVSSDPLGWVRLIVWATVATKP